jgi:hypothetical protein
MKSRFTDLLQAHKGTSEATEEQEAPPSPALPEPAPEPEPKPQAKAKTNGQPKSSTADKPRGRPKGKRSDPDYMQVTAYIREATYDAVKVTLLTKKKGLEFSELVEELLAKWLKVNS